MADSVIGQEAHKEFLDVKDTKGLESALQTEELPVVPITGPLSEVIWTPRFIVVFALTLVVGLSGGSLLTQYWLNSLYRGEWVFLGQVTVVFFAWLIAVIRAHTLWVRLGALFGAIWAVFTGLSFVLELLAVDPNSALVAHLNAATNSALLGCYICLSLHRVPFKRWDNWFFQFAPLAGAVSIAAAYLLAHPHLHHLPGLRLERTVAAAALFFCIFVWWLRPSCWKSQPGPTFLFGLIPFILLLLALPGVSSQTNFFFVQFVFLCTLLGIMRILQGEKINSY